MGAARRKKRRKKTVYTSDSLIIWPRRWHSSVRLVLKWRAAHWQKLSKLLSRDIIVKKKMNPIWLYLNCNRIRAVISNVKLFVQHLLCSLEISRALKSTSLKSDNRVRQRVRERCENQKSTFFSSLADGNITFPLMRLWRKWLDGALLYTAVNVFVCVCGGRSKFYFYFWLALVKNCYWFAFPLDLRK